MLSTFPIVPESLLFAGAENDDEPKVIFGFGGVFVPKAPYNLDEGLNWETAAMFDGDALIFSPDYGDLIEILTECGVEVFILSGMGMSAVMAAKDMFELKRRTMDHVNWLNTYSEFDLGAGPSMLQQKAITVRSVCAHSKNLVIWVDPSAWMLQETDSFKPIQTCMNSGMTLEHLAQIAELAIDDDWDDDEEDDDGNWNYETY